MRRAAGLIPRLSRRVALATLVASAVAASAAAQAPAAPGMEAFSVAVPAEATGANAIEARTAALADAQRRASRIILPRLVSAGDAARVPALPEAQIDQYVRGVEVSQERTTATRYAAVVTVVFSPDAIRDHLRAAGVAFVDVAAPMAVVVPLWRDRTGVRALADRNEWREAWLRTASPAGLAPTRVLVADTVDQQVLAPEQAFVGDVTALSRIAQRYQAQSVLIAVLNGEAGQGPYRVSGTLYNAVSGARRTLPGGTATTADKLEEAAAQMVRKLEEDWKSVALVDRTASDKFVAEAPLQGLGDWVKIRQRLAGLPQIKTMNVQSLQAGKATLEIEYQGTREQLVGALQQRGLSLTAGPAGTWILTATGAP